MIIFYFYLLINLLIIIKGKIYHDNKEKTNHNTYRRLIMNSTQRSRASRNCNARSNSTSKVQARNQAKSTSKARANSTKKEAK